MEEIKVCFCCSKCERDFTENIHPSTYNDLALREACERYAVCPDCTLKEKQQSEEAAKKRRLDERYRQRREASNIDKHLLPFDPTHPAANRALWDWMGAHSNDSVVLSSETGRGKSRILTNRALEALKSRSVYYSTAADLCDALAAKFTKKEEFGTRFLTFLNSVDLLVIDDLGKESITDTRVMRLWQVIDSRYTAHMQHVGGMVIPDSARRGRQIWVSSNWKSGALMERMGNAENSTAIMRRLREMAEVLKG